LFRSGLGSSSLGHFSFTNSQAWLRFVSNYVNGYGWFLTVLAAAGAGIFIKHLYRSSSVRWEKIEFAVLFLAFFPVLLHHLIFFNFTSVHDFSVLKDAVLIALLSGILCHRLMQGSRMTRAKRGITLILAIAFICSLVSGVDKFWKVNKNSTDVFKVTGQFMASMARPDEVVFVAVPLEASPHIVFYAQRNTAEFWLEKDARELIKKNGARRGIIFDLDEDYNCTGYRYLD
jgi:hypothetical protein